MGQFGGESKAMALMWCGAAPTTIFSCTRVAAPYCYPTRLPVMSRNTKHLIAPLYNERRDPLQLAKPPSRPNSVIAITLGRHNQLRCLNVHGGGKFGQVR